MREIHQSSLVQTAQCFLMLGGMIAAVAAPLILFIEAFEWLFSREWPGMTLADGLSLFGIYHEVPETAAQRAIDVAMAAPLAVALFLTGMSMFLVGINFGSWEAERRLEEDLFEDPVLALALLVSGTELSFTSFLRMVVLDSLLRFLIAVGSAGILAGFGLWIAGIPSGWIVPAGAVLIAMSWLSRLSVAQRFIRESSAD